MTVAMLIKTENGLRGSTTADHENWGKFRRRLERLKPGTWLRLEWAVPRNGKHHRKLFALLQLIAENSETYTTPERALIAVKLVVGHFDLLADPVTGEVRHIPRSISYDRMDQDAFEAFYSQAIDAVLQHILPAMDRQEADRLLDMIVDGWA